MALADFNLPCIGKDTKLIFTKRYLSTSPVFCEYTIEYFLRRDVDVAVKMLWYWYLYWDDTLAHMRSACYWCRAYEQKSCLASKTTFTVQIVTWMLYIYTTHNKKQNPGTLFTLIDRYSLEGRVLDMYRTIAILLQPSFLFPWKAACFCVFYLQYKFILPAVYITVDKLTCTTIPVQ